MEHDQNSPLLPPLDFQKLTLSNGLDVIVARRAELPLVAVNLWYHVGSKNEGPRQRGYAHLFEHLMFEGSQHYPDDFFKPLQRLGASINGSTSADRTNYFVDLPNAHFELALAMESDRMGFLIPALGDEKLRVQKSVVKNEYRQNYENRPYGQVWRVLAEALYPPQHPYNWLTIGAMEDLEAATREDVAAFFQRFYVPANASLALVGDLDPSEAFALAERYFGGIAGGTAALPVLAPPVVLESDRDVTLHDRVELDRIYQVWPTVPQFEPDDAALTLLGDILARGRASRLHRRLVLETQLLQDVSAYQSGRELAGSFAVIATQRPGRDLAEARRQIDAEIRALAVEGPTDEELLRVKHAWSTGFVFALGSIGGFGGLADRLNGYNVYQRDPAKITTDLARFWSVTADDVRRVAATYLSDRPRVRLMVVGSRREAVAPINRAEPPPSRPASRYLAPVPEVVALASGAQVWLIPQRGLPRLAVAAVARAGAAEHGAEVAGLAHLTAAMLDEGTAKRDARELALAAESLGASVAPSCGWDAASVQVQCLSQHARPMIDLVAELVWQPTFPEDEWARVHAQTLASLKADRDRVESLAYKALLRHLYPPSSPFHAPLGGTLDSVTPLTRDAARHFHARHYSPARVAWIVSGDFERSEILDLIEAASDRPDIWNPSHAEGTRPDPLDGPPRSLRVALAHRAGSVQAMLRAGQVGLPRAHPDHEALALWNQILGGQFSSRLNEVLREQKGYTYGIRSHLDGRRAAGPFWIGAALEAERLADALRDLIHEIEVLLDARPPTQNEIDDAVRALVEGQARQFETPGELVSKFGQLFVHNLPPDHHAVLADRLARIQRDELHACAKRHIDPRAFVIAIAGDADRITPQIESLGWDAEIVRD